MSGVEQESRHLRQELGLTDLVLTQIMYIVGLSSLAFALKVGGTVIIANVLGALMYVRRRGVRRRA